MLCTGYFLLLVVAGFGCGIGLVAIMELRGEWAERGRYGRRTKSVQRQGCDQGSGGRVVGRSFIRCENGKKAPNNQYRAGKTKKSDRHSPTTHPKPASTTLVPFTPSFHSSSLGPHPSSHRSFPYRHIPASILSESRAPRPASWTALDG
jgi:hypothetical protein